ncbi:LOW QUALITY PROTEIN: uncharacterized protein [Castor canadensis]|uniref:LOW QUALITY PROTEIN: uncharacterized protein n=1 Tax=Castor canadensis TaxID=51338 RepID=A0AC58L8N7_CASCN
MASSACTRFVPRCIQGGFAFSPDPARDPGAAWTRPGREGRGRQGPGRERWRPGTHVLAVAAPREPGCRRDKSADGPAGRTRASPGALPRPLWDAGGLTRWSGLVSAEARDQWAGCWGQGAEDGEFLPLCGTENLSPSFLFSWTFIFRGSRRREGSVTGQWQVIGPDKSIQVLVGENAIFSCFLSPETNAETMEVQFFKNQFDDVVLLYRGGKDQKNMKMPEYRGRTELVKDSLYRGHATLRLDKVTLRCRDASLHGCWFSSQTHGPEAIWELQVTELGSPPLISLMKYTDGGIQLLCRTSGWFPQPTVKWKGPQGPDLSSDSKVKKDTYGLFDVETTLTIQESFGKVSCSVQHRDQNQVAESRVWIRGKMKAELANLQKNLDQEEEHRQADVRIDSGAGVGELPSSSLAETPTPFLRRPDSEGALLRQIFNSLKSDLCIPDD